MNLRLFLLVYIVSCWFFFLPLNAIGYEPDLWQQAGVARLSRGGTLGVGLADLAIMHANPAGLGAIQQWGLGVEFRPAGLDCRYAVDLVMPRLGFVPSWLPLQLFSLGAISATERVPDGGDSFHLDDKTVLGLSGAGLVWPDLYWGTTFKHQVNQYRGIPDAVYPIIHTSMDLGLRYQPDEMWAVSLAYYNAHEFYLKPVWSLQGDYLPRQLVLGTDFNLDYFNSRQRLSWDYYFPSDIKPQAVACGVEFFLSDQVIARAGFSREKMVSLGIGLLPLPGQRVGLDYSNMAGAGVPLYAGPLQPAISVFSEPSTAGLSVTNNIYTLKGRVDNIQGDTVLVNGQDIPVSDSGDFLTSLVLFPEANKISLSAKGLDGNLISKVLTINLDIPMEDLLPQRNYYALLIGNNHYNYIQDLQTPRGDAQAIEQLLRQLYGFKTTLLLDASYPEILSQLADFSCKLKAEDAFLLYYAGHGMADPSTNLAYWLPVDAQPQSAQNRISSDDLSMIVSGIAAKHVLVISDSCFAGALTRSVFAPEAAHRERYIRKMLGIESRTILTSGGDEPVLDSGNNGHSIFANALLQALTVGAPVFTTQEIYYSIKTYVTSQVSQTPEYKVMRHFEQSSGEFVFRKVNP